MIESIINSVILLTPLGIVAALVLYVVSKKFYVYEDPLISEVEELLPAANCAGCGSPGCRAFAEKLVATDDISDLFCPVGGNEVMKLVSIIECVGHTGTHFLQSVQYAGFIYARLFSIMMAPLGQTSKHLEQPIQATSQAFLAMPPFSSFRHPTNIFRSLLCFGRISIISLGQASTHIPQEVHLSVITTGRPVVSSMYMASNLQAATQSPSPRQPY